MLTPRLILKELDRDYVGDIAAMMAHARVNEFFFGFQKERSDSDTRAYIDDYFYAPFRKAKAKFGIGGFAIHTREAGDRAGAFAGITGLFPETSHHPECGPEIIYVLGAEHHGKGYAIEAAKAVIDRVSKEASIPSVCLTTDAPNAASRAVATKLGFTEVGTVEAYGADDMVFYVKTLKRGTGQA